MRLEVTDELILGVKCFSDKCHRISLDESFYRFFQGEAMEVVAVLGASNDSSRYAYQAVKLLKECGHRPIPVHPREAEVQGLKVIPTITQLVESGEKVDTVTIYVNSAISEKYEKDLVKLAPKRVIFNPGAESSLLEKSLRSNGIAVENACTLVMLRTEQF